MKLKNKFAALQASEEMAFMPYICVGDPDAKTTVKIARTLVSNGADVLELGLPFSDPIADGPTIQRASQRALSQGMNTDKYFTVCKEISEKTDATLVSMTYYNLILHYGIVKFAESCSKSGVSGIIVPDLPFEESLELEAACGSQDISLIQLVALTSDEKRLDKILKHASGFIYLVSVLGVTGAREKVDEKVLVMLEKIKSKTNLPVCLGFGISTKEHVSYAKKQGFSGVIVGSALIDLIEKNLKKESNTLKELSLLAQDLHSQT